MKFFETNFAEYVDSVKQSNLHPELVNNLDNLSMKNAIFFGPCGSGKYSQLLYYISKFSPSKLKHEKKMNLTYDKKQYLFKISDIHIEVDMALLGCNAKLLWHEIYTQIIDVIMLKINKIKFIVCKNFHEIHGELLDNFFSYVQHGLPFSPHINFLFLTETISFLPRQLLNLCTIIPVKNPSESEVHNLKNMKIINDNNKHDVVLLMTPSKNIAQHILNIIIHPEILKFTKFRDILYDLFIYDFNIHECIWHIIYNLIQHNYITNEQLHTLLFKTFQFFKYYNNNYRPIYHIERFLFFIINIIHYA